MPERIKRRHQARPRQIVLHQSQIQSILKRMPLTSERLANLRREITDLRSLNATFFEKKKHTQIDQSAAQGRAQRLLEIREELSVLLSKPDSAAWW
jgi:hypothetical protein